MGQNASDVLLNELLENQDDLVLFLTMHYGFRPFYENLCVEFFEKCLDSRLRQKIQQYNNEHKEQLTLNGFNPSESRAILLPNSLLNITSSAWPKELSVFLESSAGGCSKFSAGVTMDYAKGNLATLAIPFENAFRECFNTVLNYKLGMKYIWCAYLNWNSLEIFPVLVKEVLATRNTPDAPYPMADYYVDLMMKLVKITDEVTKGHTAQ